MKRDRVNSLIIAFEAGVPSRSATTTGTLWVVALNAATITMKIPIRMIGNMTVKTIETGSRRSCFSSFVVMATVLRTKAFFK